MSGTRWTTKHWRAQLSAATQGRLCQLLTDVMHAPHGQPLSQTAMDLWLDWPQGRTGHTLRGRYLLRYRDVRTLARKLWPEMEPLAATERLLAEVDPPRPPAPEVEHIETFY